MKPTGQPLRELLHARARAIEAEALRNGGTISTAAVDELTRLQRLVDIREKDTPPRRSRWPVAAVLVATLALASLLLFVRVRETQVEIDVAASAVSFRLPRAEILLEAMPVAALGVSGLGALRMPGAPDAAVTGTEDATAVRLEPAGDGAVTLPALVVPAGALVRLEVIDALTYRISLDGDPVVLDIGVTGAVRIGRAGLPAAELLYARPRTIRLESGPGRLDMDVTPVAQEGLRLPPIPVTELSLVRIDEIIEPETTVLRERSTILAGNIVYAELGDALRPLREGQSLRVGRVDGEIQSLGFADGRITLRFTGAVRGLASGRGAATRSLMPTWLEWLHARHGLSLLWGTALYVFGVALVVLRWWGLRV